MTEVECARLLRIIQSVDYREVNPLVVKSWYETIGRYDYDVAVDALSAARGDPDIDYLYPKHILKYADIIIRRRERAERVNTPAIPEGVGGAPKPDNFDAMADAYDSDDPVRIAREVAVYEEQLRKAGYSDEWTESGRVDYRTSRFPRYTR